MFWRRTYDIWPAMAIVLGVLFLWATIYIDLTIFAGILLAVFLSHLAAIVTGRLALARGWSLAAVIIVIAALLAGTLYLFADTVVEQVDQLTARLATALGTVEQLKALQWARPLVSVHLQEHLRSGFVGNLFGVATNMVIVIGGLVVVAFLGMYLAAEPTVYMNGFVSLFPENSRPRVRQILSAAANALWYWTLGRLFSMSVVCVGTVAGLWALGMPLPFVLGGLAGLLTFVPYLGSIVAAVPAIVFALSMGPMQTVYIIVLYTVVHLVEGYVLVPLVQRQVSHLPPALILSSQLVFGTFAGVIGVTFATPLAAALVPIIRMAYVEDALEAHVDHTPVDSESMTERHSASR
jgi:predicted PurR-regulated permease PerM